MATTEPNNEGNESSFTSRLADAAVEQNLNQLVVILPVGEHRLAILGAEIKEVVAVNGITSLPASAPALLGAISVRGALLPLYELRRWCDGSPARSHDALFGAICEVEHSCFAIGLGDHPSIVMTSEALTHGAPVLIDGDVCIGIDASCLFRDLISASPPKRALATGSAPVPVPPISSTGPPIAPSTFLAQGVFQ